jgi:hypothetical protein
MNEESIVKRMEELKEVQVQTPAQLRMEAMTNVEMPSTWKVSAETRGLIKQSLEIYNTKHGMYSAIPMMCKGKECPYASVCPILDAGGNPKGQRCPLEIGIVLKKFEEYCEYFHVDDSDVVDMGLIKDLVDYDVQLFRAENRIAMEGDFLEDVIVTVTESGQEITNKAVSKAAEYKERIMNKKHKVLELMNSTRKDKAGDKLTVTLDPSTYASQLMSKIADQMKPGQIIDADYEDVDTE